MCRRKAGRSRAEAFARRLLDELLKSTELAVAFDRLPPRWQFVLIQVEVHGMGPAALGRVLSMAPRAATALIYRANEGLRLAYLQELEKPVDAVCARFRRALGAQARDALHADEQALLTSHLTTCAECARAAEAVSRVASGIGSVARSAGTTTRWGFRRTRPTGRSADTPS
ncbi:hypothetical protein AB0A74_01105 [Saccharothrix sp. NPDC042600]|uniref:hypothetical protein n=1 Tax=Saccharothrix TaxID=2071 RepID=UPI0033C3EE20|nr:hypothetical protein GCM10017745_49250 [Saccharothrix mutabilis subsp. capreolus]